MLFFMVDAVADKLIRPCSHGPLERHSYHKNDIICRRVGSVWTASGGVWRQHDGSGEKTRHDPEAFASHL